MTKFNHQPRSGRRKKGKGRSPRGSLGIPSGDVERLEAHRELEALRNPTPERFAKLAQIRRRTGGPDA
jgi:hypothetical protein